MDINTNLTNEKIFSELTPLFREILDNDDLILSPLTTAKDVDTWDSLNHIRLIVAIENRFKIRFTSAEVTHFANVGDLVTAIIVKLT